MSMYLYVYLCMYMYTIISSYTSKYWEVMNSFKAICIFCAQISSQETMWNSIKNNSAHSVSSCYFKVLFCWAQSLTKTFILLFHVKVPVVLEMIATSGMTYWQQIKVFFSVAMVLRTVKTSCRTHSLDALVATGTIESITVISALNIASPFQSVTNYVGTKTLKFQFISSRFLRTLKSF